MAGSASTQSPSLSWRFRSLHGRVALVLGALLLVLALLLALTLSKTAESRLLQLNAAVLESLSQQLARELSGGMDRLLQEAIVQAQREEFRDAAASPAAMRTALDAFQETFPHIAYAAVVDADSARVLAAGRAVFEGGSARGRPVFEQGLKGPFLGDVHDAVRLAEMLPRPASGETLRFLDASAPI